MIDDEVLVCLKQECFRRREIFTWNNIEFFSIGHGDQFRTLVSHPNIATILDISLQDIPIWQIDLAWKPDTPAEIILDFKTSMTQAANGTLVAIDIGGTGDTTTTTRITNLLNKVFNIIILMTMFLCFFALSANMSANLIEQTKEIGVLRAIGFRKSRIILLYFYEAIVLVLASSTTGVLVGMVVAETFVLQQTLIMQIPGAVFFPWRQFVLIVGLSFICAFFSTVAPCY